MFLPYDDLPMKNLDMFMQPETIPYCQSQKLIFKLHHTFLQYINYWANYDQLVETVNCYPKHE